jgi:hypothetical protein
MKGSGTVIDYTTMKIMARGAQFNFEDGCQDAIRSPEKHHWVRGES